MTNRRRNRGASRPRAGAADEANGFSADIAPEKPDEPCALAKPIWLHPSVSDTLREWSHPVPAARADPRADWPPTDARRSSRGARGRTAAGGARRSAAQAAASTTCGGG